VFSKVELRPTPKAFTLSTFPLFTPNGKLASESDELSFSMSVPKVSLLWPEAEGDSSTTREGGRLAAPEKVVLDSSLKKPPTLPAHALGAFTS